MLEDQVNDDIPEGSILVSLTIVNTYELHPSETTFVTDEQVPAPESLDEDTLGEWADEYLMPFTGTGHTDGDSWYDVSVTASSLPELVGKEFDFGY